MRNLDKIEGVSSWCDPRKYIASAEEDKFVINYFNNKTNGFLLDIGAADAVTGSNSFRLLNEFDWSGILVEPNPNHRNNLEKLFNDVEDISVCYNVVHQTEKSVELFIHYGGRAGFTNINKRNGHACATVEAKDINSILEEFNCPHNIDYISMDIESSEHHVLNHWNFDKYNVQLWCLEGNQFANLMKSKGYKLLDTNGYKINDSNTFWGLA